MGQRGGVRPSRAQQRPNIEHMGLFQRLPNVLACCARDGRTPARRHCPLLLLTDAIEALASGAGISEHPKSAIARDQRQGNPTRCC